MELIRLIQFLNLVNDQQLVALFTPGALQTAPHNGKYGSTHPVELAKNMAYQAHG
jgi:hypothetical protein